MLLITVNKPKQLLYFSFIGQVRLEEVERSQKDLVELLKDLNPGFRLLTDLERLESIGVDCAAAIGRSMELCDEKGVDLLVRVIPEQGKDIGFSILARFHYEHTPRTVTCKTMVEAGKVLGL
jgi:hypothetical protein